VSRRRRIPVLLTVIAATVLIAGVAGAKPLPAPGTPSRVAALVKSSHSIRRLPSDLVPPLSSVGSDTAAAWGYWKIARECTTTTKCVYGDTTASKVVVLFGDSHAAMWLPAFDWAGRQLGVRVVLLWTSGCPAADVTVLSDSTGAVNTSCNAFRKRALTEITALAPTYVFTANRTTNVNGPGHVPVPHHFWQLGLESTLKSLLSAKLDVAVLGDVTALTKPNPECLAAYPTHVQHCSSRNPNPAMYTENGAEKAAARTEGVPYVNPEPWLCTRVCSPVVGKYAVYYDWQHVSATYAAFLGQEFERVLESLLPSG
jgi:SGNH domain (fused to AT3 domains)